MNTKSRLQMTAVAPVALALALAACGGGGGGNSPTQTPTLQTQTFTGTATANTPTSCTGASHVIQALDGPITVTLVESTGSVAMATQVCAGSIDNNDCSVQLQRIEVGQTVSGSRKGAASQTVVLQPANCGGGGPAPSTPIAFSARVTFMG
jgi:hypothetical protein